VSFYVSLVCEAVDPRGNRCWVEDSYGDPQSATEARRRLHKQGWHRAKDGRDICPDCWAAGLR